MKWDDKDDVFGDLETEFNDQIAELKSIHGLVDDLTLLLYDAQKNVLYAGKSFRGLQVLKLRLNPILYKDKYKNMFGGALRRVDELFKQLEPVIEAELLRGRAFSREHYYYPPTSASTLRLLDALFNELNILKTEVGMGMRMRPVFTESARINQAME